jgi:hypothetical protein
MVKMPTCLALVAVALLVRTEAYAAAPDPLEEALGGLGYSVRARADIEPTAWEKQQFELLAKRSVKVKRVKPLPKASDFYPRFTILEERYADAQHAVARLARLMEPPPGLVGEEELLFPLRKGFVHENLVVVVTTDAVLFETELGRLTERLQHALAPPP